MDAISVIDVQSTPVTDEAEMAVLGAVLLSGTVALPAIVEEGVRPEDFRLPVRATIFDAMQSMHELGDSIDRLTLADYMVRHEWMDISNRRETIDLLACSVPNVGNLRQYARIVVRSSMWRTREWWLKTALEEAERQNEDGFRRALGRLRECELRFRPLLERDLTTP